MINNKPITTVYVSENSVGKINSTFIKLQFPDRQIGPCSEQALDPIKFLSFISYPALNNGSP
jgi:hypothetical protein